MVSSLREGVGASSSDAPLPTGSDSTCMSVRKWRLQRATAQSTAEANAEQFLMHTDTDHNISNAGTSCTRDDSDNVPRSRQGKGCFVAWINPQDSKDSPRPAWRPTLRHHSSQDSGSCCETSPTRVVCARYRTPGNDDEAISTKADEFEASSKPYASTRPKARGRITCSGGRFAALSSVF